jgi:diguanylate cyclase (GGDEF)-like protein/PAS domain S-box-containing protein
MAVLRDISDRRLRSVRLAQRDATLRAFLECAPHLMGIVALDDGRLVHASANQKAVEVFGLQVGNGAAVSGRLPGSARWERACRECLETGKPSSFTARFRDRWLSATITLIENPENGPARFAYAVEDVTERRVQQSALARRDAEFEAIYQSIPDAAVFCDADHVIRAVNPAFGSVFGYGPGDAVGKPLEAFFVGPETPEAPLSDRADGDTIIVQGLRASGDRFVAEACGTTVRDESGNDLGYLSIVRDVTAERSAQEHMRMQANIMEHVRDAVVVLDAAMRITFWNRGAEAITGYGADSARGRSVMRMSRFRFLSGEDEEASIHALLDSGQWTGRLSLKASDDTTRYVETTVSFMRDGLGEVSGILVVARDISSTVELEERLRRQAVTDTLTRLPNRAELDAKLNRALEAREERGVPFALLFIDLDRFKLVNDSLGHAMGDALLQQIGNRIRETFRPSDVVARIGGDEFAVLMSPAESEVHVRGVAHRLQEALSAPFVIAGRQIPAAASIGIVMGDARYRTPDALLRDADTAMYEAKRKNGASYVLFSEAMHRRVARRFRLETDLAGAAARGELEIHYQPIVALASGRVASFEALVRWRHPELGILKPTDFLDVAAETGRMHEIDLWMINSGAAQLAEWLERAGRRRPLQLHLNVESDTAVTDEFMSAIADAMERHSLPTGSLVVEITEKLLMDDVDYAADRLRSLRDIGVEVALDDFGSGYSSLSLLHRLPVQTVKTDRSLLLHFEGSQSGRPVLESVAELAQVLGLKLVAEGIETREQLVAMRRLGYTYGQGFIFSRPRQARKAEALLKTPDWMGMWADRSTSKGDA